MISSSPQHQPRSHAYGGIENRIRFTVEVVEAVAAEIGPERTELRISPGNTVNGIAEGEETGVLYRELASVLADRGLAYLHVGFADPASAVWQDLRKLWTGTLIENPVLAAGQIPADGGRAAAEAMLAAGADLVALGRPFLANPGLVHRLRTGAPLNAVRDKYLMYVGRRNRLHGLSGLISPSRREDWIEVLYPGDAVVPQLPRSVLVAPQQVTIW